MAATTVWKPAYALKATHDGDPIECKSLEIAEAIGEFDTTNNEGGGAEEFGIDVTSCQMRFTVPQKDGQASLPKGALVDMTYDDGDDDPQTGKARILTKNRKGGGKGGYDIDYTAKFTGGTAAVTP